MSTTNTTQLKLSSTERFTRFFLAWVFAYPVLWIIGLGGVFWVVLGLVAFVFLLREKPRGIAMLAILIGISLIMSAVVGTVYFGFLPERLISLGGNVLVWIAVGALLHLDPGRAGADRLARGILVIALVQGALSAVSVAISPLKLPVPFLSPIAGGMPSGFAAFARNNLYFESWLDGFAARSAGMNAQPTWAGAFACVALIVGTSLLLRTRGKERVFVIAAMVAAWYSLQLSLSRSTWISLGIAAAVMVIVWIKRRQPILGFTVMTIGGIAIVVALLTRLSDIQGWLDEVNSQREGSAETRGAIYDTTWSFIHQLPVPILGYGIKPQESDLVASVATHSSYLGLIFRGGYLGAILFAILLVTVLTRAIQASAPQSAAVASLLITWCIFEDFDPGHLVPLGLVWAVWTYRTARRDRVEFETPTRARVSYPRQRLATSAGHTGARP